MELWVLRPAAAQAAQRMLEQNVMLMDWESLPDLSAAHNAGQLKKILRSTDADAPPESLARRTERIWPFLSLSRESIIALPLPDGERVAFAEVTGNYQYDEVLGHTRPVRWIVRDLPLKRFGADGQPMRREGPFLIQISDIKQKRAILARLKLPRQRRYIIIFWCIGVLILIRVVSLLIRNLEIWHFKL